MYQRCIAFVAVFAWTSGAEWFSKPAGPDNARTIEEGLFHEFEVHQQRFGWRYVEEAERLARFGAFRANLAYVVSENAKGHTYTLGLNEFADMSPHEFAMTHFGLRRPGPASVWGRLPHLGAHRLSNVTLPADVDWTSKGAVTPPKNQGSCGSCWSFSTTGAIEGAWQIETGTLISLSEQQLVDCSTENHGCSGGSMELAFMYEEAIAACTEESYPYMAKQGICKASSCSTAIPKGAITGYKDVAPDDELALMDALVQQPVSVAIEADQRAFQLYRSGVLSHQCGDKLDHGVLAVGYGVEDGTKYWKVKNSWGASWGMGGYVKILRGRVGAGMCGIKSQPTYPVVMGWAPAESSQSAISI